MSSDGRFVAMLTETAPSRSISVSGPSSVLGRSRTYVFDRDLCSSHQTGLLYDLVYIWTRVRVFSQRPCFFCQHARNLPWCSRAIPINRFSRSEN